MPYIVEKVNGKPFGPRDTIFTKHEIDRLEHDGNTYTIVNTTTGRRSTIGGKRGPEVYATSFCNSGHRMADGKPVDHECYVIPPRLLRAERENAPDTQELWGKWSRGRRVTHRGLKRR